MALASVILEGRFGNVGRAGIGPWVMAGGRFPALRRLRMLERELAAGETCTEVGVWTEQ